MPEIKIKHVVSFSSEEKPHKAENLLGNDTTKKWKCAPGEKQACIVLQLEKSTNISSIDIGNEGAAFVEVLVGRSSRDNVKYQVLLVASSFMSPQESRVGTSPNRVRIFGQDKLSTDTAKEKWDIVKVVCTQPFNKRASYGLTFLKLHSPAEKPDATVEEEAPPSETKTKQFGSFKLKTDNSDSKVTSFNPGQQMLLAKKDQTSDQKPRKEIMRRSRSPDPPKLEEKRRKVETPKAQSVDSKHSMASPVNFGKLKAKNTDSPRPKISTLSSTQTTQRQPTPSKAVKAAIKKKRKTVAKPFHQILDGVVFVISGFQNPLRSDIREMALRMGAQYRKDWTPDSTHLVCAFPNTPKFRQVTGMGGKIVRKDWIEECGKTKRLVSWKNYAMNSDVSSSSSSEEEIEQEEAASHSPSQTQNDDDPYDVSTDEGGDTEDEIEKMKPKVDSPVMEEDPYDASTDDEGVTSEDQLQCVMADGLPRLPDYFEHKNFLLYGEFQQPVHRLLTRHIVACGGKISKYMNDDIEYVISEQTWDEEFDRALSTNAALVFVKPSWVFHCGAQQKLLPPQPYLISHA